MYSYLLPGLLSFQLFERLSVSYNLLYIIINQILVSFYSNSFLFVACTDVWKFGTKCLSIYKKTLLKDFTLEYSKSWL
jgi:hypothetical protein